MLSNPSLPLTSILVRARAPKRCQLIRLYIFCIFYSVVRSMRWIVNIQLFKTSKVLHEVNDANCEVAFALRLANFNRKREFSSLPVWDESAIHLKVDWKFENQRLTSNLEYDLKIISKFMSTNQSHNKIASFIIGRIINKALEITISSIKWESELRE